MDHQRGVPGGPHGGIFHRQPGGPQPQKLMDYSGYPAPPGTGDCMIAPAIPQSHGPMHNGMHAPQHLLGGGGGGSYGHHQQQQQLHHSQMVHPPPYSSDMHIKHEPMEQHMYWDYDQHGEGRDEVSSSGINGYNSPDSGIGGDLRKKRPPYPRAQQQEELCLVCGDRASGYHYNALTCEGCKGFFRRSITKNAVYQCKYGGNCEIDMYMRRKCQECRLRKCLTIGMRPECVVPETQCKAKRESKQQQQQQKDKPLATTTAATNAPVAPVPNGAAAAVQAANHAAALAAANREPISPRSNSSGSPASVVPFELSALSNTQLDLIQELVRYQDQYELPSEEDFKSITPISHYASTHADDQANRFQHVAEITILTVQLIVEFAKRLPGFETISREDQIALLKACASELMMLRCSRRYDTGTDSIVFANNVPFTRENYNSAGLSNGDGLYNFCKSMCAMRVDNAEYAILSAIIIFSERPMLQDAKKVEMIQESYLAALRGYLDTNRSRSVIFARLLMRMTELRTLGHEWTELLFSLKLQKRKLPPLLSEIWDFDGPQ